MGWDLQKDTVSSCSKLSFTSSFGSTCHMSTTSKWMATMLPISWGSSTGWCASRWIKNGGGHCGCGIWRWPWWMHTWWCGGSASWKVSLSHTIIMNPTSVSLASWSCFCWLTHPSWQTTGPKSPQIYKITSAPLVDNQSWCFFCRLAFHYPCSQLQSQQYTHIIILGARNIMSRTMLCLETISICMNRLPKNQLLFLWSGYRNKTMERTPTCSACRVWVHNNCIHE